MKVALYKDVRFGFETVSHSESLENSKDYIRISEFVDVEFPPIGGDAVAVELASIERARVELERKHDADLAKLDGRKAVLQASLPEVA